MDVIGDDIQLCRLKNTDYSKNSIILPASSTQDKLTNSFEDPEDSAVLSAANYAYVDADENKSLSKLDNQLTRIQKQCEGKAPAVKTEFPSHEIDEYYSAVDVTNGTNTSSDKIEECPLTVTESELTTHDIDVNYSAVEETDYTYSSVDKDVKTAENPPLPAHLQYKPPPSVPNADSKMTDSEILSTYDSIGPKLTSSAVSVELSLHVDEVENDTYSVVDVTNVTSIDKTTEKPPLPKRPEGKLPPPAIPVRSFTTSELTSQDIDTNYSVVDGTNTACTSINKKQKSIRRPSMSLPQLPPPPIPVRSSTTELSAQEIDANYSVVETEFEDKSPLAPVPDESIELTSQDIDANYSAVGAIDQTEYTYSSVDKTTKKPPLPTRLQCKPPPPVPDVGSIGPNMTAPAVELSPLVEQVEDDTYSVVDVASVARIDKTTEKPPLPKRPEGKLPPPPIPVRSFTTSELTSQDIDTNYSVVDGTNTACTSINRKQKSFRRPSMSLPQLPPTPALDQTLEAKLDSTYDTIGPSLIKSSTVQAKPLPPAEEKATSTVDKTNQASYTYASVDMSRKTSGENLAKKLPPPKPARDPPPSVSDTLPDGYIYSEVTKKSNKLPSDS